jgi:uncharacterized protein (DUF2141 family)
MKTRSAASLLAISALGLMAARAQAGDLTVNVGGTRSDKGQILVAIYDKAENWNKSVGPVATQKVDASRQGVVLHFQLPPGTYALELMHDENGNGKLDKNAMGIPTEGYGYSNNPNPMRRAHFDEAQFVMSDAGLSISVKMR